MAAGATTPFVAFARTARLSSGVRLGHLARTVCVVTGLAVTARAARSAFHRIELDLATE